MDCRGYGMKKLWCTVSFHSIIIDYFVSMKWSSHHVLVLLYCSLKLHIYSITPTYLHTYTWPMIKREWKLLRYIYFIQFMILRNNINVWIGTRYQSVINKIIIYFNYVINSFYRKCFFSSCKFFFSQVY